MVSVTPSGLMAILFCEVHPQSSLMPMVLAFSACIAFLGVSYFCKPNIEPLMETKEFLAQRINIYAGKDIDPNCDKDVKELLRKKFNIHLPQRPSMNESLRAAIGDHEILSLITQYRTL